MEKFLYEIRPFTYLGLATYALVIHSGSLLMQFSGGILLVCSAFIFAWRAKHRGLIKFN